MKHEQNEFLRELSINPFLCKWSSWIECDRLHKEGFYKWFTEKFVLLLFREFFVF